MKPGTRKKSKRIFPLDLPPLYTVLVDGLAVATISVPNDERVTHAQQAGADPYAQAVAVALIGWFGDHDKAWLLARIAPDLLDVLWDGWDDARRERLAYRRANAAETRRWCAGYQARPVEDEIDLGYKVRLRDARWLIVLVPPPEPEMLAAEIVRLRCANFQQQQQLERARTRLATLERVIALREAFAQPARAGTPSAERLRAQFAAAAKARTTDESVAAQASGLAAATTVASGEAALHPIIGSPSRPQLIVHEGRKTDRA